MPKEKYEIKGKLGEGGTATVYFVVPKTGGRGYAFKVLSEHWPKEGLIKEMCVQQKIRSRYVPKVIAFVEIDGIEGLLMEYKSGLTLEQYLKENGAMSEVQILRLGMDLCKLLVRMHARHRPICYLDLKPANIILKEDRLKALVDFGCAKEAEPGGAVLSDGKGTPRYAAPEQFGVGQELGSEADIYALGMVLLEAAGESALSERTSGILASCVRQEAKERIASAQILLQMLEDVYSVHCKNDKPLQKHRKESRIAKVVMTVLLVCVLGAFMLWNRRKGHELFEAGWELWCLAGEQKEKRRGCELCKESLEYTFLRRSDREKAAFLAELCGYYESGRNVGEAVEIIYRLICYLESNERIPAEILCAVQEFSGTYYRMTGISFPEMEKMLADIAKILENSNIFNSAEDALRAKDLLEMLKVIERTKKGNLRNEIYK